MFLSVRKESPDFTLVALAAAPPSFEKDKREAHPWSALLRRGDSIPIKVFAFRRDNFNGVIELGAEGLPSGVTANAARIPAAQNASVLVLTANCSLVGTVTTSGPAGAITAAGHHVYVGSGGIVAYDISNPTNPVPVATFPFATGL